MNRSMDRNTSPLALLHNPIEWSIVLFVTLVAILSAHAAAPNERWPMFRGPANDGHAPPGSRPPVEFGPGKNEIWNQTLPRGHSSPSVWDDRVFVTGSESESKQLETLCLERTSGKVAWRSSVTVDQLEEVHKVSSQANATPATDGECVISYFGAFGLVCYDIQGKERWRYPMPVFRCYNSSGTSPILVDGLVILGREDRVDQMLVALEVKTGAEKWKTKHPNSRPNWLGIPSSPILWNDQILVHRAGSISGYAVRDGQPLWLIAANTTGFSTPVIGEGKLIVAAWNPGGEPDQMPPWPEFDSLLKHDANQDQKLSREEFPSDILSTVRPEVGHELEGKHNISVGWFDEDKDNAIDRNEWTKALAGRQKAVHEIKRPHGILAVELPKQGYPSEQNVLWRHHRNVPEIPSPLVHKGRAYLVKDGGLVLSVDLNSGKLIYQQRLGTGGPYLASPLEASGKIYFASVSGKVTVVADGDEFKILATNDMKEGIYASPVVIGNQLLIRTDQRLFAFQAPR